MQDYVNRKIFEKHEHAEKGQPRLGAVEGGAGPLVDGGVAGVKAAACQCRHVRTSGIEENKKGK